MGAREFAAALVKAADTAGKMVDKVYGDGPETQ